jgi:hypothetical protein
MMKLTGLLLSAVALAASQAPTPPSELTERVSRMARIGAVRTPSPLEA